jgi:CelD/BcsL family acetyltransferase involved in cellulose biosynthesis
MQMKLHVYGRSEWNSVDVAQWASLADASISINPFYEHWNLLPALRNLADDSVSLITLESDGEIHALLPVVGSRIGAFTGIKSWKHNHCFVNTPLFRSQDALSQLVRQALTHFDTAFFNMDQYAGNIDLISDGSNGTSVINRACQALDISWDQFLSGHSKRLQSEYRRILRKADTNHFQYSESSPDDSSLEWFDAFSQLEGSGWKGSNNSAIICNDRVYQYYLEVIENGWSQEKMQFQKFCKGGTPVAISFRCVSRGHCYCVKTSFDEDLRSLSPGIALELNNLKSLFESEHVFADSCSSPDNAMLNRLFLDRLPIASTLIYASTISGRFANLTYGSWRSYKYRDHRAP